MKAEALATSNVIEETTKLLAQTKLLTKENEKYTNVLEILSSNDFSLSEQVQAYETILKTVTNPSIREAITNIYHAMEGYRDLSQETLEYLDKMGLTADKITTLNKGYSRLDSSVISKEQYQARTVNLLTTLANAGGDIQTALHMQFDDILNGLDEEK